jgi:hypothetical protein
MSLGIENLVLKLYMQKTYYQCIPIQNTGVEGRVWEYNLKKSNHTAQLLMNICFYIEIKIRLHRKEIIRMSEK